MKRKHINPPGPVAGDNKTCTRCLEVKSLSEFYKDKVNKSGYRSYCKSCMKRETKQRYDKEGSTGKVYNARMVERKNKLKGELVAGAGGACIRCGYSRTHYALDFHHIGDDKENAISNMLLGAVNQNGAALQALRDEVAKCVLLCANCHRELHAGLWQLT